MTQPTAATPKPREMTRDMLPKLYEVGEQSIALNRLDEAAWCFEKAGGFDPGSPRHLKGLAQVRQLQGRPAEARALIERAVTATGGATAENHTIMGQICQAEGDFVAAAAAFQRAIAIKPTYGHAHLRLSLLPGADGRDARIATLERLRAAPGLEPEQVATLAFALGAEYEKHGEPDRAFERYHFANEVRRGQYPGYSNTFADAGRMIAAFPANRIAAASPLAPQSERPVFVVGMMRSGTTLVEQILASHPDVHGHGEMSEIYRIAAALNGDGSRPYPECLATTPPATLALHAANYLIRLERDAPASAGTTRRSIDKLPHNFEHVGLIHLLFPNARIIHCDRDPLDACISNYFHDFGPLNPFTYDLAKLGNYHREYQRLMQHWHRVLPDHILRVPYEALVADLEGYSRKMIAFLGLDWNEACLDFHRNPRPVFTKSLWQVRQPIFTTSIGRWRRYATHLGPLFQALGGPNDASPESPARAAGQ